MDLKYKCKLYDRRVSLALIPFLKERIEYLRDEIDSSVDKDLTYLK